MIAKETELKARTNWIALSSSCVTYLALLVAVVIVLDGAQIRSVSYLKVLIYFNTFSNERPSYRSYIFCCLTISIGAAPHSCAAHIVYISESASDMATFSLSAFQHG